MAWIKKKTLYPATILIANLYFIYISIKRFWSDYLQRKLFVNMFSPERENYKPRLTCHLLRKLKCFMGLKFSKYLPTTGKWGSIRQIKSQYDDWYIRQMYPKLPQIYIHILCHIYLNERQMYSSKYTAFCHYCMGFGARVTCNKKGIFVTFRFKLTYMFLQNDLTHTQTYTPRLVIRSRHRHRQQIYAFIECNEEISWKLLIMHWIKRKKKRKVQNITYI